MILDKGYRPPEGFWPILNHSRCLEGEPVVGFCRLYVQNCRPLDFCIGFGRIPALTLKGYGEMWHAGWYIPTLWAIDADRCCWMDNGLGHPLREVPAGALLECAENPNDASLIRVAASLEEDWMCLARAVGWAPSKGNGK